jgi:hypothetical protein
MSRICKNGHDVSGNNAKPYTKNGKKQYTCRQCAIKSNKRLRQSKEDFLPNTTPTVMAHYKEPLRTIPNGYGYYGTLAYDETHKYTQCHECGNLYKNLGNHVSKAHALSPLEYRDKYSIGRTIPLTAPKAKNKNFEQWANMTDEEKKASIARMTKARENRKMPDNWRKKSLYHKNLEGNCPDQLLDSIEKLAKELGRTPTRREFMKHYEGRFVGSINLTYGSWGQALQILKLTPQPAGFRKVYTRELLVKLLIEFRENNNREPMSSDCDKGLLPPRKTFAEYFGSWSSAKEYAKQPYLTIIKE